MYEDVCLLCGRPVPVDGRAYCSDECESLDTASPSISTSSSALASPYLRSHNGSGSLADVPALVSSAMGRSLQPGTASKHKNRHSISSSSTSSAVWSVSTDEEDELASAGPEDDLLPSVLHGPEGTKSADPYLYPFQPRGAGLAYARRPSGTNQRSTVPTLHRHASGTSSALATGTGSPRSAPPYLPAADESPDVPPTSASTRSAGLHERRRNRNSFASDPSSEQEVDHDTTITSKRKRNRASLPAYFSLLTTPTPPRAQQAPSSLQTLTATTRSFQSSPPTPRVAAHPILDLMTVFSQVYSKPQTHPGEATQRGRGRERDPEARSASSRRSTQRSPPRQSRARASRSPPPCAHRHAHIGPQARARLDSIEKVADWVSHSPAVPMRGRTLTRRNSSPPVKPRLDAMLGVAPEDEDIAAVREALAKSLHFHPDHADVYVASRDRRGRRRPDELDLAPAGGEELGAPGYGAGRSGLIARERERGRPSTRF